MSPNEIDKIIGIATSKLCSHLCVTLIPEIVDHCLEDMGLDIDDDERLNLEEEVKDEIAEVLYRGD